MVSRLILRFCALLVGLGIASHAAAGTIDCGVDGSACGVSLSIEGAPAPKTGTFSIDPKTGALSLANPIGLSFNGSNVSVENIHGNADPILGFGIGASTGGVGSAFSITLTLPISLTGTIIANSSINYSLTSLSGAGAQLTPLFFGKTLIAQELDTTVGGIPALNKGVNAGNTFFFLGGPATNPSPVYTASSSFAGNLAYDLMSVTVAFSLSPNTTTGISGFVQQVVPEPSAFVLIALGLGALAWRRSASRAV